jgi:hypothetical protein
MRRVPKPGEFVGVIAEVIEAVDASQSIDVKVLLPNGTIASLTDLDLIHRDGDILFRRAQPAAPVVPVEFNQ